MPRKAKPGGMGNRTDLLAKGGPQPVTAAAGQPYGARKATVEAQQAQPLPGDPVAALMADAGTFDGTPTSLLAPTARPNEPVTAGLSTGPGPGPEVLLGGSTLASDTFEMLANQTGDETMRRLAAIARSRGR